MKETRLLDRLRIQLTLGYLAASLSFIALISALIYTLLGTYAQETVDLALRRRIAQEFVQLGQPLPAELATAEQEWQRLSGTLRAVQARTDEDEAHNGEEAEDDDAPALRESPFLLWLKEEGQYLLQPAHFPRWFAPSLAAIQGAKANGHDLRTVEYQPGRPIRLFTYPVRVGELTIYLQAGRPLTEQRIVSGQLMGGIVFGGGALALLAALVSWIIAGHSLRPAREAWLRQRDFVANASHELRAPLSIIQLSAEMASQVNISPEEQRELLAEIRQETQRMAALINNLLLLSRADAGKLQFDIRVIPLKQVLEDLTGPWSRLAQARGIALTMRMSEVFVWADARHLHQALTAILDNALRYTPAGGSISVDAVERNAWVNINVQDTGPGIPAEHLPRIFERFHQVDPAHNDKQHSGLGLSIVKALIKAMDGEVSADSQLGSGTTIVISLRRAQAPLAFGQTKVLSSPAAVPPA